MAAFDLDAFLSTPVNETTAPQKGAFDIDSFLGTDQPKQQQQEQYQPNIDFSKEFTVDDLANNDNLFKVITDVNRERYGREFKEGDDRKAVVDKFLADQRFTDFNTAFGTVSELAYIKNASPEKARNAALARRVYENTKSFYEEGGQGGISPYIDIVKAIATDPLTYAGFGVGKAVGVSGARLAMKGIAGAAAKEAVKGAVAKTTAVSALTEGVVGAAGAYEADQLNQAVSEHLGETPRDTDWGTIALTGLFSAAVSGATTYMATSKQPEEYVNVLSKKLKEGGAPVASDLSKPATGIEQAVAEPVDYEMRRVTKEFMKSYGKNLINEIDPANVITDAKVKNTLVRTAVQSAFYVMKSNPEYAPKPGERAMTALARVISETDAIDGTFIESGLKQLGKTKEEFAAMFVNTASEAGQTLGSMGFVGKWMKGLAKEDPTLTKQLKDLYGTEDEYVSAFSKAMEGLKRVERESKVWITSGIDTLMRNAVGTAGGLTMKSAAQLMEGFVYSAGVGIRDGLSGKGLDRSKKALADSFHDAINTFYMIMSSKGKALAVETTDELLKFNPTARDTMLHALQETGNQEISRVGRWANTLNVAVDGVFRRAVFTASVEKQLRDIGMDMYQDFIAKNKVVPTAIIKKGIDDSLKATFSYMPKQHKGIQKSFETSMENGASALVSAIEKAPFSSLAIPFPRFMANAMAFQYRYSPVGWLGIGKDLMQAKAAANAGKMDKATMLYRQANMKFAQGSVGLAGLAAAYQYRKNHQDQDWYMVNLAEGGETDIRALFPLAPYFAVADFIHKQTTGGAAKSAETIQAIVGMKLPAGTQNVMIDQMFAAFSSEKDADALAKTMGNVLGDFVGRFTQPFVTKQVFDILDMFREDGSVVRDPNVVNEDLGTFGSAAIQRVQNKLPILKEYLPPAAPKFSPNDEIYREGEVFNRLIGVRQVANKTPEEKELIKLELNPYSLFGASSGDKEFDNEVVRRANKELLPLMGQIMSEPEYQNASKENKKLGMSEAIRKVIKGVKAEVKADWAFDPEKESRYWKMEFDRMPKDIRKFINNEYKLRNGMTLEEAGAYNEADDYKILLQKFY